jgi:hypothetical protein
VGELDGSRDLELLSSNSAQVIDADGVLWFGEGEVVGWPVAAGEVLAALGVVVGLDRGVLRGAQHRVDLGCAGEGVEVGVVPGVAAQRMGFGHEALDLAVQGEQLLDEGAAEVRQHHRERCDPFDVGELVARAAVGEQGGDQ